jgi:4-amino-4-deoxy-L-arabinose transferase
MIARTLAPLDLRPRSRQALLVAWCLLLVILRAVPAYIDATADDGALARDLSAQLPAPPNEAAFVDTDPRYGLRFYLDAEVERLELPGSMSREPAQDIVSEMREHEGCRVLLVNDYNLGRLQKFLDDDAVKYKRLADVRGYVVLAQRTADCAAYAAL